MLGAIRENYWAFSRGISVEEAKQIANAHGFGFRLGRNSYFDNDSNSVFIGRNKLRDGQVNLIELAEEIQHGLDRASSEASRFIRRYEASGYSAERLRDLFHVEHFERIIRNWEEGMFPFLSGQDIADIKKIIEELKYGTGNN
jgi:hypothetical protein